LSNPLILLCINISYYAIDPETKP